MYIHYLYHRATVSEHWFDKISETVLWLFGVADEVESVSIYIIINRWQCVSPIGAPCKSIYKALGKIGYNPYFLWIWARYKQANVIETEQSQLNNIQNIHKGKEHIPQNKQIFIKRTKNKWKLQNKSEEIDIANNFFHKILLLG